VFLVGDPNQAIYGFNGADKDLFDSLPGFSTGANVVFNETYISHSKIDRIHRVTTESGKLIAFSKDDNCGCGSRLRSWNPYGSIITVGGEE
jgi:hypothetical protein